MTYQDVLAAARPRMGAYCNACPVCDGRACRNSMPGPGAKGIGDNAIRNYEAWKAIRLNLDTLCAARPADTTCSFLGMSFSAPFFAGPVGAVNMHYGESYTDITYNNALVSACAENGIAAFTGDGTDGSVMKIAAQAIAAAGGIGVPTIKPWNLDTILEKLNIVRQANPFAVAMDVDAAGLPFLRSQTPPAGGKSVEELRTIIQAAEAPFLVKGIMTAKGALKAKEAGASAIIVSNHGGRVLDQCASTAEVLPEIAAALKGSLPILVDGGIRSGADIFKALALGATGVLICRPFVTAVYGGGTDGAALYIKKLKEELEDTMRMCGAFSLAEITPDLVRLPR